MIDRRWLVSVVACGAFAGLSNAQCYEWEHGSPPPFQRSAYLDVVYDSARNVIVGFRQELSETWEWTPQTGWVARDIPGPGRRGRGSAALAYDAHRGVAVLYGGYLQSTNQAVDETWEYDGSAWTLRDVSGPGAHIGHALAYDPVRQRMVLTGGVDRLHDYSFNPATWEYDGSHWTLVSTAGPARAWHAAAYSAEEGMVIVAGGGDGTAAPATLGWNGVQWTTLSTTGPGTRYDGSLTAVPSRGSLVMFGGTVFTPDGLDFFSAREMWEFRNGVWRLIPVDHGPRGLDGHGAAFHPALGELLMMGGMSNTNTMNEVWGWNGIDWRFVSGAPGEAGALIAVPWRDDILYCGLYWTGAGTRGDMWWWDGHEWRLEQRDWGPQDAYPYLSLDAHRGVIVAFFSNGETWELDQIGWNLRSTTGPLPRFDVQIAYDSVRNATVLFGGTTDYQSWLNDTWEWDGAAWRQHEPAMAWDQPRSSMACSMAFDEARGVTVLAQNYPWNATWEYDGVEWREVDGWSPGAPIVYDPVSSRVMAFSRRVRAWDGTQWTDEGPVQDWSFDFPPINGYSMTLDTHRRRLWIYPVSYQSGQRQTFGSILIRSADHDRSGEIDVFDLLAYLTDWFAGAPGADLNGDGQTNIIDLLDHLDAWFEGC